MTLPRTMRAIEITQPGGPEVLRACLRPVPQAGQGEVLVKVAASGVNRPDVLQRKGLYPMPPGVSDLPGLELAGHIVAGDAEDLARQGLGLGQAVCALVAGGGYAEYVTVPVGQVLPVPEGWSLVEAAGLPETFFTVWQNVFDLASLQRGESILVHGGSSGIGVTAIQLAKAFGAQVFTTVGNAEKAKACLALGADHAILYREADFAAEVLALTQGRGVDVVLDMVGGDYLARDLSCLADDGRIALIAVQAESPRCEFDTRLVLRKRARITGSTLRPRSLETKARLARELRDQVWPLLQQRRVHSVVHRVFAAEQAEQAHVLMESSVHIGKIILKWEP